MNYQVGTPLAERVFSCTDCKFKSGQQRIFYDTYEDKHKFKVMLLFQNPGGNGISEEILLNLSKLPAEKITEHHRDGFDTWPKDYYLFFRELCTNLLNKGLISEYPKNLGKDIMKEMYITDAVKCWAKESNEIGRFRDQNGFPSSGKCSYNFLKEEIDSLINLEVIISFGNWASDALNALVRLEGSRGNYKMSNSAKIRPEIKRFDLTPYDDDLKKKYSHGIIYDYHYAYPDGTKKIIKNIHFNHPSWFYNRGPLRNKQGVKEKLIIESMDWCFSNI